MLRESGETYWGFAEELLAELVEELSLLTVFNQQRKEPVSVVRPNGTGVPTSASAAAPAAAGAGSSDGLVTSTADGRVHAQGFMGMLAMMGASPDAVMFDGGDSP